MKLVKITYSIVFACVIFLSCRQQNNSASSFFTKKNKRIQFNHYGHFISTNFLNCIYKNDTLRKCNPIIREIIFSKKWKDTLLMIESDGSIAKAAYYAINNDKVALTNLTNITIEFTKKGNIQFRGERFGQRDVFVAVTEQWKRIANNEWQIFPKIASFISLQGAYAYTAYDETWMKWRTDTIFFQPDGKILNFYPYTNYMLCAEKNCFIQSKANVAKLLREGVWRNYELDKQRDSIVLKELYSQYDVLSNKLYWKYAGKSIRLVKVY